MITITNKYFAKKGLLDESNEKGSIRVIEFTIDEEVENVLYRAVIDGVNERTTIDSIEMPYTWMKKYGDKWVQQNGVVVSKGTTSEFVLIETGLPESDRDITHPEGVLNLLYTTSYEHIMLYAPIPASNGVRDGGVALKDMFFEMNFNTKQIPNLFPNV